MRSLVLTLLLFLTAVGATPFLENAGGDTDTVESYLIGNDARSIEVDLILEATKTPENAKGAAVPAEGVELATAGKHSP